MSSNGKNGKQKKKNEKKEKRANEKLALALDSISKLKILNYRNVFEQVSPDTSRNRSRFFSQRSSRPKVDNRWRIWIRDFNWLKLDQREKLAKDLSQSGVIPHGVPIPYLSEKKPLRYAFIHYWMKADVRLTDYCHEALERMCGKYLVYFLQTGSHIVDSRIFSIDAERNVKPVLKPHLPRQAPQEKSAGLWTAIWHWILGWFGLGPKGDEDEDEETKTKRNLDDTFHVTEWLWDDDKEKKRCGPLIPFERFHTATLVPARDAPESAQASTIELASDQAGPTELDAEFLVLQDEGGDQISGTFQFKGTIGKFRGRRRKNIPEVGPLQKTPQIPLEKLSEMNGIDRQLIDDLLNDLNMNSHRADP